MQWLSLNLHCVQRALYSCCSQKLGHAQLSSYVCFTSQLLIFLPALSFGTTIWNLTYLPVNSVASLALRLVRHCCNESFWLFPASQENVWSFFLTVILNDELRVLSHTAWSACAGVWSACAGVWWYLKQRLIENRKYMLPGLRTPGI